MKTTVIFEGRVDVKQLQDFDWQQVTHVDDSDMAFFSKEMFERSVDEE